MCGIAGVFVRLPTDRTAIESRAAAMGAAIRHRGPDDDGVWSSACGRVAFSHRRLAIVDLSPSGRQPMSSMDGRYTIAFNGEIYNYRLLRDQLLRFGHSFVGTSDTEVLLAAVVQWGLLEAISRSVGMFALALWDGQEQTLSFARDRFGEKPLYIRQEPDCLLFGSELRAIVQGSNKPLRVDPQALSLYLKYGYVPEPLSIFEDTRRLRPSMIEVWGRLPDGRFHQRSAIRYWTPPTNGAIFSGSRDRAVDKLQDLLGDSIAGQMLADVPVGCLLSGGIDSTAVAAAMQSLSPGRIFTFCVAFDDPAYNEAPHAAAVSRHLGTEHIEIPISVPDPIALVSDISSTYDEPFSDSSQIPMMALSRAVRQKVKVALSGDGGDEMFGGYNRYYWATDIRRRVRHLPKPMLAALATLLTMASRGAPSSALRAAQIALLGDGPVQNFRGKLQKAAQLLRSPDLAAAYIDLMSILPAGLITNDFDTDEAHLRELFSGAPALSAFTLWDLCHYLPNDNLVKVDRASMAVGLEVRAPLLDHRICMFARSIVSSFGYQSFRDSPKWPLRQLVYRHVPKALVERPKMGFSAPVGNWLRHELAPWAKALIEAESATLFPQSVIQQLRLAWAQHTAGSADRTAFLWAALMLIQWKTTIPCDVSLADETPTNRHGRRA